MQLQELKKLIEYDALDYILVTKGGGGWILVAIKKNPSKELSTKDVTLYLARGGVRVFKTLDAVYKLTEKHLGHHSFTVA